jgi:hypothetical protein
VSPSLPSGQRAAAFVLISSNYAVAFYEFTRTLESYKFIIAENTTLILSTDSELFKFLKGMDPND